MSVMMRVFFILVFAMLPASYAHSAEEPVIRDSQLELPADPEAYRYIRVALYSDVGSIDIESKASYEILDNEGVLLVQGASMPPTLLWVGEGMRFYFGNRTLDADVLRIRGTLLKVGKYKYRDTIIIWLLENGKMLVVNELSVEDYLKGVLPWEVSPDWDIESLRAQAVASRTFAVFRMLENFNERFDVSSGIMSQVYKGQTIEKPQTNEAVDSTRGQILIHEGKIFPAFFHSTSGGTTTSAHSIWNIEPHPSLMGITTEYAKDSKHFRWTGKFKLNDIREVLRRNGFTLPDILRITAEDTDESGRARMMTFHSSVNQVSVNANDFRIWIGPGKFKSTKLTSIEFKGQWVEFKGFGWGHGVGMCQYSAKRLGEIGYTYNQILGYFYQESNLRQFFSSPRAQEFLTASPN